ncbi:MAG: bifunctional riboflavin kinase/FAD synthetase [Campylobacterota bacterium]|nr:bifunctional riboflavin kinase/FAD synthetase [Campylobacterota bacterium]
MAIGGFDGMHLGHQELFKKLDKNGAIVVIQTSYANLSPDTSRSELTDLPIFYYPLDDIKHLNGNEFISLLKEEFVLLNKIVVGFDFHFGYKAAYSIIDLKNIFDGTVEVIKEYSVEAIGVHSRIIRELLRNGDIKQANKFLGYNYKIDGIHIKGQSLGSKQFVPTINLNIQKYLIPKDGIYITKTVIDNKIYSSVSFIGHRVSTDGNFAVETHILENFEDNIKSKKIQIVFCKKIRDNKKFENYKHLKNQILDDIEKAKKYFNFCE